MGRASRREGEGVQKEGSGSGAAAVPSYVRFSVPTSVYIRKSQGGLWVPEGRPPRRRRGYQIIQ